VFWGRGSRRRLRSHVGDGIDLERAQDGDEVLEG
jgi:hypothetical protein